MNAETECLKDFFSPWAKMHAEGYPRERSCSEVDVIVAVLQLPEHACAMAIPCRTGPHSIELSRRGFIVTGIVLSAPALSIARGNADNGGVSVNFDELELRRLNQHKSINAAISFYSRFRYFSENESLEFATRVARALKLGGRIFIDRPVTKSVFRAFHERRWMWRDKARTNRVHEETLWDSELGRIDALWDFMRGDGTVERVRLANRIYSHRELYELLQARVFRNARSVHRGQLSLRPGIPAVFADCA